MLSIIPGSICLDFPKIEYWILNGCWPLKDEEHVVILTENGLMFDSEEEGNENSAKVKFFRPIKQKGYPEYSFWAFCH